MDRWLSTKASRLHCGHDGSDFYYSFSVVTADKRRFLQRHGSSPTQKHHLTSAPARGWKVSGWRAAATLHLPQSKTKTVKWEKGFPSARSCGGRRRTGSRSWGVKLAAVHGCTRRQPPPSIIIFTESLKSSSGAKIKCWWRLFIGYVINDIWL